MSDNKTLLFNQTKNGYLNLYTLLPLMAAACKAITSDKKDNRSIALNKTRTKAVYLSGRDEVSLIDLKTWRVRPW
jgi:tricorn protease